MIDALAPGFLIAFPHLSDPNFRQSVVLLLEQSDEGAMGVVINHDSSLLLSDLCRDHSIPYLGDRGKRVRRGGPLEPEQGLVLYGPEHQDPEGQPVVAGLHLSTSRATLTRLCNNEVGHFQCYSGYAGWGPDQLEEEIAAGVWIVAPVSPEMVFESRLDKMWRRSLFSIGIDPAALVPGGDATA